MNNKNNTGGMRNAENDRIDRNIYYRFMRGLDSAYIGELEGISDYIYYSLLSENNYPGLYQLFENHALDEMRHFDMLGSVILDLGGNPVINANIRTKPVYINNDNEDMESALTMIERSLKGEYDGIEGYKRLIEMAPNDAVRGILGKILIDEERHVRELQYAKNSGQF